MLRQRWKFLFTFRQTQISWINPVLLFKGLFNGWPSTLKRSRSKSLEVMMLNETSSFNHILTACRSIPISHVGSIFWRFPILWLRIGEQSKYLNLDQRKPKRKSTQHGSQRKKYSLMYCALHWCSRSMILQNWERQENRTISNAGHFRNVEIQQFRQTAIS